ncbi:MAG: radical SAM protein [Desulfamplus sp.]|nr:radical SAM protein [Desulfamplus sp.]
MGKNKQLSSSKGGGYLIKEFKKGDSIEKKRPPINRCEKGGVTKKQKHLTNIALVYPNTYQIGMSNLGFQSVYGMLNKDARVSCNRFFMSKSNQNYPNSNKKYSNSDRYPNINDKKFEIKSCETAIPLSSSDLIAFSVSFENDYINIVSILKNSGIPLRASDRNASHPFIIAGGIACFLNPEPIAPFIDCFLLGEAEYMLPAFLDIFIPSYSTTDDISYDNIKKQVSVKVNGAYIPEFYQPFYDTDGNFSAITPIYDDIPAKISVQHIKDLSKIATTTQILTNDTTFENTFLIEIGRGCHHGCRFCSAGFIYRPSRFYPEKNIVDAINQATLITDKIGLVSPTVSDHPDINTICNAGIDNKLEIGFSSLRLDALTDATIENLIASSVKTATIAPEAGSQRMRNIINKKISEEQIFSAVQRLVEHGIMNLKLYFMVGLPFELEDDVRQIVTLTEKIKEVFLEASRKNRKIGNITLSINPFIPKPTTPFQWCAMDSISNFKKKAAIIKDGLKKISNITIHVESSKTAMINAMLSRGDRRMADMVENPEMFLKKMKETEKKNPEKTNMKKTNAEKIIFSAIDLSASLPWDILDTGIKKEFLIKELKRAELEKTSPDCPMVECSSCGVCKKF